MRKAKPKPNHEALLSDIFPNPSQPRKVFEPKALEELAASIREQGLIEPIVVTPRDGKFMIIAGERRWRACHRMECEYVCYLEMVKVPVRIIEADERQVAEMALVENLQRQDLTPLEEANAYREMLEQGYTRDELAKRLGLKQPWRIDERMALLKLAPKFQEVMAMGILTPTQAFELSRLDYGEQEMAFRKIQAGQLTGKNSLRRFVDTWLESKRQASFFAPAKPEHLETAKRWDRTLEATVRLVLNSFSPNDCQVLGKVTNGDPTASVAKIDLLIKHLHLIRDALVEAGHRKEIILEAQVNEM